MTEIAEEASSSDPLFIRALVHSGLPNRQVSRPQRCTIAVRMSFILTNYMQLVSPSTGACVNPCDIQYSQTIHKPGSIPLFLSDV